MALALRRRKQVEAQLGISRSTVYEWIKSGVLPPPIPIGRRAVGWIASEIDEVIRGRVRGLGDAAIKLLVTDLVAARKADAVAADAAEV